MHDTNDQGLLQEIEEDLARQRMEKLWKKYGPYVMGAAMTIILVTAAISGYNSYRTADAQKTTAGFLDVVMANQGKSEEFLKALEGYGETYKGKPLAVIAKLEAAATALDENNKAKALEIYDALAVDETVEPMYRDLANLLYAQTELDTGDAKALEARLQPLMAESCAWRFTAREFAGYLAIRTGDKEKAKQIFTELKALKGVPGSIDARAKDILIWLDKGV